MPLYMMRNSSGGVSPASFVEGLLCAVVVALFAWQFYRAWRATRDGEGGEA